MNRNSHLLVLVTASMLSAGYALAASPMPKSNTTVSQLDTLHDQIAVLKEELQIAKLKAGIKSAGKDGLASATMPTGFPGIGYGAASQSSPVALAAPRHSMPRIVSIDGRGSHLSAVLMMPDGGEVVATPGLGLRNGLTVHDITPSGVRVMRGGNLVPLSFIGSHLVMPEVSSQTPVSAMPLSAPYPPVLPGAGQ